MKMIIPRQRMYSDLEEQREFGTRDREIIASVKKINPSEVTDKMVQDFRRARRSSNTFDSYKLARLEVNYGIKPNIDQKIMNKVLDRRGDASANRLIEGTSWGTDGFKPRRIKKSDGCYTRAIYDHGDTADAIRFWRKKA